ncbi:MAG: hypothetical protein AAGA65_07250 [Actinomycetota bacterium]
MADLVRTNPTLFTSGPLLVLLVRAEYRRRNRLRVEREQEEAVVHLVDRMIAGLRSGSSLAQVHREADGLSHQLLAVTVDQLLHKGGPAIPALQRLRHTLVGRVNGRRRARAESAQALVSAGLLLVAPVVFAVAVAAVDPAMARFYRSDPVGAVCVFVAVALAGVGWFWMWSVEASVVREVR